MSFSTSVVPFNSILETLSSLDGVYGMNPHNARQRVQLEEIQKILVREKIKTMVMEEYVDRHFIHDFCGHYGSCYYDYPKKCIRIHFFSNVFSQKQFQRYVSDCDQKDDVLGKYAGFIIIRPIPGAILSNVSLAALPDSESELIIKKEHTVHLCGMDLKVTTIPFQEQDHAISACATSALWMALQAVPGNQPQNVPSPYMLTVNANKVLVDGIRSHAVTKGLTLAQIACAIKEEKLDPLTCTPHSMSYTKALLKAYLNMRVPVILGVQLYYRSDSDAQNAVSRKMGFHSVTALGFSCGDTLKAFDSPDMVSNEENETPDLYIESSAINALYCHDDQIGPYSKMSIPEEYSPSLTTEWGRIHEHGHIDAKIVSVTIPCNSKVRIRFSKMYEIVKALNVEISGYYSLFGGHLSWDIRLENVCDLKKKFRKAPLLDPDSRYALLAMSMPRYVWAVDQLFNIRGKKHLIATLLFDATDIENSNFLIRVVHYGQFSYALARSAAKYKLNDKSKQESPEIVRYIMDLYKSNTAEAGSVPADKIILSESH